MKFDPLIFLRYLSASTIDDRPFFVGARKKTLMKDVGLIEKFENYEFNEFKSSNDWVKQVYEERESLVSDFKEFYFGKCDSNLSVVEIFSKIQEYSLRMVKLKMVFHPTYYQSRYEKKSTKIKYDKVKIVWIRDDWEKHKNTTRSYGRSDEGLIPSVIKFLMENEKFRHVKEDKIVIENKAYKFDLMVEIDQEDWVFKVINEYKQTFIDHMVQFDSWKIYKREYKL